MRSFWRNLSVSKKLFIIVGFMGALIATELLSLRFAMNTLSAVRAFVGGEGLWSKAQKTAVLNLTKYANTRDPQYYEEFTHSLDIPLGDRQARIEMAKPDLDEKKVFEGFLRGRVHPEDIHGLVTLVRRFHRVPHLARALEVWESGDRMLIELTAAAEELHLQIQSKQSDVLVRGTLRRIELLDARLTDVENEFSYVLGEGSRWLENMLMSVLLIAVAMIEGTGLWLTITFSRNLSRGLTELRDVTTLVGQGEFNQKIPVRSNDELGQLAHAVNVMAEKLEENIGTRQQAEKANREKSLFLANMSHEIRTPLGAILGFTELLRDNNLSELDRQQYIGIIHRTGLNLSQIINDILDLSKVEAGRFQLEKTNFSLLDLLQDIEKVIEVRRDEKPIELIFQAINGAPDIVHSDPLRLRQILMNLLGNAVKFTESGSIRLTYEKVSGQLVFTIRDTGIGLTPEQAQQLFKAFSQVDNSSIRKYEGTGLGLVLSRHLARFLGGDVFMQDSAAGKGSVFVAKIPFEEPTADPKVVRVSQPDPVLTSKLKGKNILVVEDTRDNQLLIEKILTKYGVHITMANNGKEGLNQALAGNFDLVIMDVQMPVMDGYTAAQELRKRNYKKPIIALTAHAMKEDRAKCLQAGYSDYLTKPIQVHLFARTLSEYV